MCLHVQHGDEAVINTLCKPRGCSGDLVNTANLQAMLLQILQQLGQNRADHD